jgi:hypothetical protein
MREWIGEGDTGAAAEETLSASALASSCNVDMGVAKPLPELMLADVGLALPCTSLSSSSIRCACTSVASLEEESGAPAAVLYDPAKASERRDEPCGSSNAALEPALDKELSTSRISALPLDGVLSAGKGI